MAGNEYDFSFSGLKTAKIGRLQGAVSKVIRGNMPGDMVYRNKRLACRHSKTLCKIRNKNDLAASFQKTVAEILTQKTIAAAKEYGYKTVALAGGVSANSVHTANVIRLGAKYITKAAIPKYLMFSFFMKVLPLSNGNFVQRKSCLKSLLGG